MRFRHLAWLALALVAGCAKEPIEADLHALLNADAAGRKAAAERLGALQDARVGPALAKATRDADEAVRCAAASGLGKQSAEVAVDPLVALLRSRLPGRDCAIAPLGQLKDAKAAGPLVALAQAGDARALEALGQLGPSATTALVNALRREADANRAEGFARALVAAAGKDAYAPLQAMVVENDRLAKTNAILGLGIVGDPQALDTVKQAADAGIGTAPLALARLGPPGLKVLLERLDHPKEFQRRLAAAALAQAREPSLVPLLEDALRGESPVVADASARALASMAGWLPSSRAPDPALQSLAAAALERAQARGDTRALALGMDRYLRDHPDGADAMIDALEMHGDERLAGALLRSDNETLRAAAGEWAKVTRRTPCAGTIDAIDCAVAAAPTEVAP